MKHSIAIALLLVATAGSAVAAATHSERQTAEFSLDIGGSFVLDNPFGNVDIVGADQPGLVVTHQKDVNAVDQVSLREGRELTRPHIAGDNRVRIIRTELPIARPTKWKSSVTYLIRVPRTVHVKVTSNGNGKIRIANIAGNVTVKNVNGTILLENITGATTVDSVNGNIIFDPNGKLGANAQLVTVNGQIEVRLAPDSNFEWIADSIQGDFRTDFPARVRYEGSTLRGSINAPGGPTLRTAAMMGQVFVIRDGSRPQDARSVRMASNTTENTPVTRRPAGVSRTRLIEAPLVQGNFVYATNIGDFAIGEVRGSARIETGAGAVQLGTVMGESNITTLGGPLDIGDAFGWVVARTGAGDILVRAAREGGLISTGGGNIRLLYSGGPANLTSGGGDITVRQAAGPVQAATRSGDISITLDPNVKTQTVEAKTSKGSIILNVHPRFAADIDATVLTSNATAETIRSDIKGLSITREQVGDKTRVRAVGKINGGGEKVELTAEDGGILLSTTGTNAITVMTPR